MIARYSRPAMARIWSDEGKYARWLDVELAALEGWVEAGVVPADTVAEITAGAVPPSAERVAEIEEQTHHDVAAFVDAVAEQLGPAGRWFHYGLTSSDVVDTALAMQIRDAGALILFGLERAFTAVITLAEEHRETLQIGRTHGIHAEPTTFGLKLAGWAFELDRDRTRLERALEGMRVGKLSGAVGTYSATDPEVERVACERLGLEPAPSSTQILQRDRHAELLSALAVTAASLEKFALEIRHLARTEVSEVQEPFGRGQKGSSAMPHKRNPVVAERICGLARVVRAAATVGLENVALWHERDISHSSAERVVIPDAFLALDYMLDRFAWLIEGLVVRPERMRRNLESSHGLFFSQRLLLALVESGLERDEAYRLVQRHALRAWDEEQDFRELVRADRELAGRVDLDAVFDLATYTRHVDTVFERLRALVRKEETIHA
ncbi:MAG: adenylosuccinate lyase [Actinomycetota bacterium]|nr:adenylosuccinate lyase [Actinomycetota bacterium]